MFLYRFYMLIYFLEENITLLRSLFWVCLWGEVLQILNKWTDFYEIWRDRCAFWSHTNVIFIYIISNNKILSTQIREVVTIFHAVGYCNVEDGLLLLLLLLLLSKPLIKFLVLVCLILSTLWYLYPELFILQVSFVRILGKLASHCPVFLDCHRAPPCDLFCSIFFCLRFTDQNSFFQLSVICWWSKNESYNNVCWRL
jgi:hypothetical protein